MQNYNIRGREIELDEMFEYREFFWDDDRGILSFINFDNVLGQVQEGAVPVDDAFRNMLRFLRRWEVDAPRKRQLRKLRRAGFGVLSDDEFFEETGGYNYRWGLKTLESMPHTF